MIISANTDELESNSARASRLCGSIRADAQALDSALKALQASWKGQAAPRRRPANTSGLRPKTRSTPA